MTGLSKKYRKKLTTLEYTLIHHWLHYHFGSAERCENPKCEKKSTNYMWAKLKDKPYARDRSCFHQLCSQCHGRYDYPRVVQRSIRTMKRPRTICLKGHPLTQETTFADPKGVWRCIPCRRKSESNRTRRRKKNTDLIQSIGV